MVSKSRLHEWRGKMKKIISGIVSFITAAAAMVTAASAEVYIQPKYPFNGNRCASVVVDSDINSKVHVKIVRNSLEGDHTYYDDYIYADDSDKIHCFELEGKDDVTYTLTIGSEKLKGSSKFEEYSTVLQINDTDEMPYSDTAGYRYIYSVSESGFDDKDSYILYENEKTEDNITETKTVLLFPVQEGLAGDANTDGSVNVLDAVFIAKKLAQGKGSELPDTADYNNDGKKNVVDAVAIAKYLATGAR